jgi:hypothetical protein
MMAKPELRQLGQRITARYHFTPLSSEETAAYIEHRLEVAGCKRPLFTHSTLHLIHRLSGGIPRLINTICDRALLGAYGRKRMMVNRGLARKAAAEVIGKKPWFEAPVLEDGCWRCSAWFCWERDGFSLKIRISPMVGTTAGKFEPNRRKAGEHCRKKTQEAPNPLDEYI